MLLSNKVKSMAKLERFSAIVPTCSTCKEQKGMIFTDESNVLKSY